MPTVVWIILCMLFFFTGHLSGIKTMSESTYQEVEMNGTVYEFPSEMKDKDISEALEQVKADTDGKYSNAKSMAKANIPRGIAANNPGNIKFNANNDWEGQTGREKRGDRSHARFDTPESGIRAMSKLLQTYKKRGQKTLNTIIGGVVQKDGSRVMAYAAENTEEYVKYLSGSIGLNPNQEIDARDFDTMMRLLPAMVTFEQGYNPYDKEVYEAALSRAGVTGDIAT